MAMTKLERAARKAERMAQAARIAAAKAEAARIVATRVCPMCGQRLVYNSAILGWWQCSGYGAEGFRAAGSTPCSFQTFTE